nr:unnamed protein product [Callosobruchus analis]
MEGRFKASHLRQKGLNYELAIRGVYTQRAVDDKRKILSKLLSKESHTPGSLIDLENYSVPFGEECAGITSSLVNYNMVIKSRLTHVYERVKRMKLPDKASSTQSEANTIVEQLAPVINVPAPVVTYVPKSAPVSEDVFTFIERNTELALSRKVCDQDLFDSAVELFSGDAVLWYKVSEIQLDFLPPDIDDQIWSQIKYRVQKRDKSVLIFIAQMDNLFNRLSRPPVETTKVNIIRKNLLNEHVTQLALVEDIHSVSRLSFLARRVEEARKRLNFKSEPQEEIPVETVSTQPSTSGVNSSIPPNTSKPPLICWNRSSSGHTFKYCRLKRKIFCYKCGHSGAKVASCPNCSKNV